MNAKISQQALNLARAYGTITNTPDNAHYQPAESAKNISSVTVQNPI
jgi:hypothetical protein